MMDSEGRARLDQVRLAMERVRSGESEREEIQLPSGDRVTIHRDEAFPNGIRIETPGAPHGQGPSPLDDPERWAMMERVREASLLVRSGASEEEEVELDGGRRVRIVRDGDGPQEFTIESSREGKIFRARAFGPAPVRPAGYPDDLPFLSNCAVSISVIRSEDGSDGGRNVAWMKPEDLRSALEMVKSHLRENGWEEGEESRGSTAMGTTTTFPFLRNGVERVVSLMSFGEFSQIMLFEKG